MQRLLVGYLLEAAQVLGSDVQAAGIVETEVAGSVVEQPMRAEAAGLVPQAKLPVVVAAD